MPKVTIEVEDIPGGKVKITASPNFETMIKMDLSGHGLSPAQGYAISMLNHARSKSKEQGSILKVGVPRLLKA